MAHGFSKENQSSREAAYRFADFELFPRDRLLKRNGTAVPLQPKAFDALLCLVRRAGHLVSKQELTEVLWVDVHVNESNLTNLIVNLRKIVGRDAIRTVSKHGYRFELAVTGEPGVKRETYERFVRARELTAQRSLESMFVARDLYWICLAEDPGFASAWAWLGRCCWFLDKFGDAFSRNADLARAALERAFGLDSDLACAHQFYTFLQVDTGRSEEAMCRLLERLERHPGEPESLSGLVQVLRFRGLLRESLLAHKLATGFDPAATTSVAHTLFLAGEYASAIEAYGGRAAYYLDAAAWAALGNNKRAIALLRERLARMMLSRLMTALLASLLAVLEHRTDDAVRAMQEADASREPEILVYFARHYARINKGDAALNLLQNAVRAGFICAPETLKSDVWLTALRQHSSFESLLKAASASIASARATFEAYTVKAKHWHLQAPSWSR
jgi:DNA-binding winged helix-turn-helix (wHTH) protein/tetratricopeptide (TPR) repeat protein